MHSSLPVEKQAHCDCTAKPLPLCPQTRLSGTKQKKFHTPSLRRRKNNRQKNYVKVPEKFLSYTRKTGRTKKKDMLFSQIKKGSSRQFFYSSEPLHPPEGTLPFLIPVTSNHPTQEGRQTSGRQHRHGCFWHGPFLFPPLQPVALPLPHAHLPP